MSFETYASYRGYSINVWVTAARTLSLHGVGRRYKVSWNCHGIGAVQREDCKFSRASGIPVRA